ncbi:MAG TPA: TetR/AcrR family transcriptional regulator [Solirubrobacterales bacterium]|jgi:AcrR family transcriptional regulator|nr:TetR/AcrR family transcriptional regulator [Solirubrobacterales bacterium]
MTDEANLFDSVASALAREPGSSMQEIAAAAGVSRTTLHRAFGDRATLVERVSEHVLADCIRLFDEARIDEGPVLEAFDRLLEVPLPLAKAYALMLAEPGAYRIARLVEEIRTQEDRLEDFFVRGQADGLFRPDLPPRWLVYSVGSQLTALWWAVDDGFVGARDATRLLRATVLGGIATGAPDPGGGRR